MSSYAQKLREIKDFPYVKQKWLQAIKKIRAGGITWRMYCKNHVRSTMEEPPCIGIAKPIQEYGRVDCRTSARVLDGVFR